MKLTYREDSLPALSGLAAYVQHLNPGNYIAGLWEKDIGFQLGWYIYPSRNLTRRWEDPKNIDILGPTFSWSSHVLGPVQYSSDENMRSLCTLESFNVELATSNLYGQVRSATLCLSGWSVSGYDMIARLKTSTTIGLSNESVCFDSGIHFRFSQSFPSYARTEELENTISWETVMCFGLYEGRFQGVGALLLQPSETELGKYVRIGLVSGLYKSWFHETAGASTITLA
jgi:hypothetical protein